MVVGSYHNCAFWIEVLDDTEISLFEGIHAQTFLELRDALLMTVGQR